MATIGFIGLGNMGAPMAANLVKAQHHVSGYDVVAPAIAALAEKGGHGAASPAEAAPAGSGKTAKICNNRIVAARMIAVCEGCARAEKLGLPAQTLFDICSKSTSQCWAMTGYCPVPGPVPAAPSNRGYAAGFTAANMLKDLRLAQQAAGATEAATPLGAAAANLYQLYVDSGARAPRFSRLTRSPPPP